MTFDVDTAVEGLDNSQATLETRPSLYGTSMCGQQNDESSNPPSDRRQFETFEKAHKAAWRHPLMSFGLVG